MKMKKSVKYLVILSVMTGCAAGVQRLSQNAAGVQQGQSPQEVELIMGAPGNTQFNGQYSAWQYCGTNNNAYGSHAYLIVWMYQERVYSKTTYQSYNSGRCENHFTSIDWQQAPDVTIEIRDGN